MKTGVTRSVFYTVFAGAAFFAPVFAYAHEAYVLSADELRRALEWSAPNPFSAIESNELRFLGWVTGVIIIMCVVLRISIISRLERVCAPVVHRMKLYAPVAARVTLGMSLIASGLAGALYGPELPIDAVFGEYHVYARFALLFLGTLIFAGCLTRTAAFVSMLIYGYTLLCVGFYLFNYLGFLGISLLVFLLGSGAYSIEAMVCGLRREKHLFFKKFSSYGFLIFRLTFGVSIIAASLYAKFIHSGMALMTIERYTLDLAMGFPPMFLLLGAFLVEMLVGLCIVFGFELRFIALVFIGFLSVSVSFFGEAVWPHVILFGGSLVLFLHGYDQYTLEHALFRGRVRARIEPVL